MKVGCVCARVWVPGVSLGEGSALKVEGGWRWQRNGHCKAGKIRMEMQEAKMEKGDGKGVVETAMKLAVEAVKDGGIGRGGKGDDVDGSFDEDGGGGGVGTDHTVEGEGGGANVGGAKGGLGCEGKGADGGGNDGDGGDKSGVDRDGGYGDGSGDDCGDGGGDMEVAAIKQRERQRWRQRR